MRGPKKSLGQHWLFDAETLQAMVATAQLDKDDVVLEVGPGLGSLTQLLVAHSKQVIAVEKDEHLAADLLRKLSARNLSVVSDDILEFDLSQLPQRYKVVANIPYYLTSHLIQNLLEAANPPSQMVLLVQKEVAERVIAQPGQMSILSLSVQYYAVPELIQTVAKELFEPPPKVDSAILSIKRRAKPYFEAEPKLLFRLIKAGFGEKRKQLKNSLAGGLRIPPAEITELLKAVGIGPSARAQELSLPQWEKLYAVIRDKHLI